MKCGLVVLGLIVVMSSAQCSKPATPRHPLLGNYVVAGYDNSGQLIFTGEFSLQSIEQNWVKGLCRITTLKNAPEGLYDHNGNCEAIVDGKKLELDLAPLLDDGGVLFDGEIDGGRFRGVCLFDSFAGSTPFGRFEAVKRALG